MAEKSTQTEQEMKDRLLKALKEVAHLYKGDADLVRPGAEKHNVQVIEGGIFVSPVEGNYNPRLPEATIHEVENLSKANSITLMCIDYRQSGQVAHELNLDPESYDDALFASAGGAAQPERNRREAAVELVSAIYALNSKIKINLVAHNHVCGGADYYTKGDATKVYDAESPNKEIQFMIGFEKQMYNEIVECGIPEKQIEVYIADIGSENKFSKLKRI